MITISFLSEREACHRMITSQGAMVVSELVISRTHVPGGLPASPIPAVYIRGPRYLVSFERLMTPTVRDLSPDPSNWPPR